MRGPFPNMIGNNPKASAFLTLLLGCGSPNERMGSAALERLQRHRRLFHRSSECGVALSRSRRTPGSS
jgi:hypothetical protein